MERSVVVRLRAEIADFRRQMAEATKAVDGVGRQTEDTSRKATTAAGRMVQSATDNRQAWDTAGTALVGFGTVTVAALGAAAVAAVQWETAWTGVLKTVDGTPEQLDAVEGGLRSLARTLPSTHAEIAAVAEAAGQLGVRTGDIVGFTKVMIDLGETTNLSADEAATSIAQLMNVMQTAPQDVGRLGAALVALGNDGASTERDIILMAQRISGAGRIIGLTEGEVLGLANALSSVGIEVEAGGTAISTVLTDIAKAVSQGGEDLEAWARVAGVSAQDFARSFREDPAEAFAMFIDGLGRVQAAGGDVFTTLEDLGQADVRVSRALLSMATSGDLLRSSLELGNQAWKDNTALAEEAAKRYDTTAAKVEIARNGINDAAITLGDTFLPVIADTAEAVADLAEWFGRLPAPVQQSIAGVSGVAGVAALAAGAFLLTFPRVIETVRAFRDLQAISPGVATNLGRVGKAAGVAGAAFAAFSILDMVTSSLAKSTASMETTTAAVLALGEASTDLDAIFSSLSDSGLSFREIDGLSGAIERLVDPSLIDRMNDLGREITSSGRSEGGSDRDAIVKQFNAIGDSLAFLVESGNVDIARRQFELLRGEWEAQGGKIEDLRALVPAYVDSLTGLSNEAQVAEESTAGLTERFNELTGATEQLTDEQIRWREELAGINAAFVEPLAAYDSLIAKNQEAAQAAADATESTEDSWEDFIGAFPATVEGYLAELQAMVDAQNAWETNMLLLSGRVSQGTLDELARMGPEGAPLVAQLVNASDEELQRMEALFGERAGNATGQFATTLTSAAPIIAAAGRQLGQGAANEIAAKLAAGTHTVEDIMREYELEVEGVRPRINVDTANAIAEIDALRARAAASIQMRVDTVAGYSPATSPSFIRRAAGGPGFDGPVLGRGTETSDSNLALLSHNEHVWTAAETRAVGGHGAMLQLRSAALRGELKGLHPTATMRFAGGGSPAWTGGMPTYSSPGLSAADLAAAFNGMSMTLLTEAGPIRAIARAEAVSTVRSAAAGRR